MHDLTAAVSGDLYFDVPCARKQLFEVDIAVTEGLLCFRTAAFIGVVKISLCVHRSHAATATARNCLDHDSAALAERGCLVGTRHDRDRTACGEFARRGLVAEGGEGIG